MPIISIRSKKSFQLAIRPSRKTSRRIPPGGGLGKNAITQLATTDLLAQAVCGSRKLSFAPVYHFFPVGARSLGPAEAWFARRPLGSNCRRHLTVSGDLVMKRFLLCALPALALFAFAPGAAQAYPPRVVIGVGIGPAYYPPYYYPYPYGYPYRPYGVIVPPPVVVSPPPPVVVVPGGTLPPPPAATGSPSVSPGSTPPLAQPMTAPAPLPLTSTPPLPLTTTSPLPLSGQTVPASPRP